METIIEKIQDALDSKAAISAAIEAKGVTGVGNVLSTYAGKILSIVELKGETKTVTPTTSQQTITPSSGKNGITQVTVNAVTSSIDNNIQASNIKSGVSILGVNGNVVELKGETKTITATTSQQTINPSSGKNGITQITVNPVTSSIDANIVAGNIKNGVSILGVTGDYQGSGGGGEIIVYLRGNMGANLRILVNGTQIMYDYSGNTDTVVRNAQTIRIEDGGDGYDPGISIIAQDGTVPNIPWETTYTLTQSIYIWNMWNRACMLKGTKVMLSDRSEKRIEDITYDDELLAWDFDEGKFTSTKPLWIKKREESNYLFRTKMSSGKELLITGQSKTGWGHRGLNLTRGEFRYFPASVGDVFWTLDGPEELISCSKEQGNCEFFNIITKHHINLFANRILTSSSLNNLYPIRGMKFVKDNRKPRSIDEYDNIPQDYYDGLRLSENCSDIKTINDYVHNLLKTKG